MHLNFQVVPSQLLDSLASSKTRFQFVVAVEEGGSMRLPSPHATSAFVAYGRRVNYDCRMAIKIQ